MPWPSISDVFLILFVEEELWTSVEAEILDATREVHITHADAEALDGADVSKVNDDLVRQSLHILLPCAVPVCRLVAIDHILGNALAHSLGIGVYDVPLLLTDRVAVLVKQLNLADARVLAVVCALDINTEVTQCLHAVKSELLPAALLLNSTLEDTVILIEHRNAVILA